MVWVVHSLQSFLEGGSTVYYTMGCHLREYANLLISLAARNRTRVNNYYHTIILRIKL